MEDGDKREGQDEKTRKRERGMEDGDKREGQDEEIPTGLLRGRKRRQEQGREEWRTGTACRVKVLSVKYIALADSKIDPKISRSRDCVVQWTEGKCIRTVWPCDANGSPVPQY
jgi:hypothetical protein